MLTVYFAKPAKILRLFLSTVGSTDNSGLIYDEHAKKDNHIKVLHQQNGGMSDARNKGTKLTYGNYIVYIDSDDYVSSSDFFSDLFQKAKNVPDIIV